MLYFNFIAVIYFILNVKIQLLISFYAFLWGKNKGEDFFWKKFPVNNIYSHPVCCFFINVMLISSCLWAGGITRREINMQ